LVEGKSVWVKEFAINALDTLRKELIEKKFKLPSATTVKAHINKNGFFLSGSIKITELGLFKTEYSKDQAKNFKGNGK